MAPRVETSLRSELSERVLNIAGPMPSKFETEWWECIPSDVRPGLSQSICGYGSWVRLPTHVCWKLCRKSGSKLIHPAWTQNVHNSVEDVGVGLLLNRKGEHCSGMSWTATEIGETTCGSGLSESTDMHLSCPICIGKVKEEVEMIILTAQVWPTQPWFPVLLTLLYQQPILLPNERFLLTNHRKEAHPIGYHLSLAAWPLSGVPSRIKASQEMQQHSSSLHGERVLNPRIHPAGGDGKSSAPTMDTTLFRQL